MEQLPAGINAAVYFHMPPGTNTAFPPAALTEKAFVKNGALFADAIDAP
jgi:hypothetical protein